MFSLHSGEGRSTSGRASDASTHVPALCNRHEEQKRDAMVRTQAYLAASANRKVLKLAATRKRLQHPISRLSWRLFCLVGWRVFGLFAFNEKDVAVFALVTDTVSLFRTPKEWGLVGAAFDFLRAADGAVLRALDRPPMTCNRCVYQSQHEQA